MKGELGTWLEVSFVTAQCHQPGSLIHVVRRIRDVFSRATIRICLFRASGSMDPPQPEDEDAGVVQGMAVRLGLGPEHVGGVGRPNSWNTWVLARARV